MLKFRYHPTPKFEVMSNWFNWPPCTTTPKRQLGNELETVAVLSNAAALTILSGDSEVVAHLGISSVNSNAKIEAALTSNTAPRVLSLFKILLRSKV